MLAGKMNFNRMIPLPGCIGSRHLRKTVSLSARQYSSLLGCRPCNPPSERNNGFMLPRTHVHAPPVLSTSLGTVGSPVMYQSNRHFTYADVYKNFMCPDVAPVGFCMGGLTEIHNITGLPWWATIAVTTLTLRSCITLPLAVWSLNNTRKVMEVRKQLQEESSPVLRGEVAHWARTEQMDKDQARRQYITNMRRLTRKAYEDNNCHPAKSFILPFIQLPIWLSLSFALRNLSGGFYVNGIKSPVLEPLMGIEGFLWIPNLLIPDTTWILPVLVAVFNLTSIQINAYRQANPGKLGRYITNFLRTLSVLMIPISASVPSCLCWYWACSSGFGLAQNILFKFPKVKERLGLPISETDSKNPYKDMYKSAISKFSLKRKDKQS